MISPGSLLLTLGIAALVFGTKRLRNIGEDVGVAIKSFRKGLNSDSETETAKKSSDEMR